MGQEWQENKPKRGGLYWCWHDGMPRAKLLEIRRNPANNIPEWNTGSGWKYLPISLFTHFAGPLDIPNKPQPPAMTIDDLVKKLCGIRGLHGNLKVCIDGREVGDTVDPDLVGDFRIAPQYVGNAVVNEKVLLLS